MSEFTTTHLEAEQDARDRGLEPFRVRLSFRVHTIHAPPHLLQKHLVFSCERKAHTASIPTPIPIHSTDEPVEVDQNVDMLLVMAARDGYCLETVKRKHAGPVLNGEPVRGLEAVMARLTLRHQHSTGAVLDCLSVNLAKFITGHHSISHSDIALQLGVKLQLSVEATICHQEDQQMADGPPPALSTSSGSSSNGQLCTDESECGDGNAAHEVSEAVAYGTTSWSGVMETEDSFDSVETDDVAEGNGVTVFQTADEGRGEVGEGRLPALEHEQLFSSCTNGSEQPTSVRGFVTAGVRTERWGGVETEDKEGWKVDAFCSRQSSWRAGDEYVTPYSGGVWKEESRVCEVDGPKTLLWWSIEGPNEDESDDDEEGRAVMEGVPMRRKHLAALSGVAASGRREARVGKLSPMQKSVVTAVKGGQGLVMELGGPVSVCKSSVLAASRYIKYEVKYVEDVGLSEEEDGEVVVSDEVVSEEVSEGASEEERRAGSHETESDEDGNPFANVTGAKAGVEKGGLVRSEGRSGKSGKSSKSDKSSKSGKSSKSPKSQSKSSNGSDKIDGEKRAGAKKGEDGTVGARTEMGTGAVWREGEKRREMEKLIFALRGEAGRLQEEVQRERERNEEFRKEQERLLEVILTLKWELDRETGGEGVRDELERVKKELEVERKERKKLERAAGKDGAEKGGGKRKGLFGLGGGGSKSKRDKGKDKGDRK